MKVDVLSKEETFRLRHLSLNIRAEEEGNTHQLKVVMIEEYDKHHGTYRYEIESFEWLSSIQGIDQRDIETKIEEYLVDNAEDILS
ncbi:MAG: hypothetical protein RDU01_02190 [Thermodesulfovibrionales bacterium]|nr:hypothetical protein [Thermodesulfovibrionales bacterium]